MNNKQQFKKFSQEEDQIPFWEDIKLKKLSFWNHQHFLEATCWEETKAILRSELKLWYIELFYEQSVSLAEFGNWICTTGELEPAIFDEADYNFLYETDYTAPSVAHDIQRLLKKYLPKIETEWEMFLLRQELKARYFLLLDNPDTVREFEAWIYQTPQLEGLFRSQDYLALIELDYSVSSVVDDISALVNHLFEHTLDSEWETIKLKNRLASILNHTPAFPALMEDVVDLQGFEGYRFLDQILDLSGYSRFTEDLNYPPNCDEWALTMKRPDGDRRLCEVYFPGFRESVEQLVGWLDNGKIFVHKEPGRLEPLYFFEDRRSEDEKQIIVLKSLFYAIRTNDLAAVKRCVEQGADVDSTDSYGESALHYAVQWNLDVEIMKYLVSQGANVNAKDTNGDTPLHRASLRSGIASQYDDEVNWYEQNRASAGQLDFWSQECENWFVERHSPFWRMMRRIFLFFFGAKRTNLRKKYWDRGRDMLAEHYMGGSVAILTFLLDNGADINAKNNWDYTPLHYAVESNPFLRDIQYLIERGANINAKDELWNTPLDIARTLIVREVLLAAGAKSWDQR